MVPALLAEGTSRFPPDMEFRGEWRSYQDRLLQQLPSYLLDNRIHIVAAPGSGKTDRLNCWK
jgi:superfamily II DNA or RNA helicase